MRKKLLFARIHYGGLFSINFKNEIFSDLLKIKEIDGFVESGIYNWCLSELYEETIDNKKYIFGKIVKIIPKKEIVSVDKSTKEEICKTNENEKDNESIFILYPNKNLIGFEVSKTLTKKQFFESLQKGYFIINSNTKPEFDLIDDEAFVMEMLKNFSKITSAKFKLKTTNPENREEFKKIDDLLRATNAQETSIIPKPKEKESLNFQNEDSLVRQGLSMASSGYGKGIINGIDKKGNRFTIKTGNNNLKEIQLEENETEEEIKRKIIITFNDLTN